MDTSGLVSGSEADITRNLGKTTTEADLAEQQYNVGARNQAGQFNAMQKMRNTMIDQQRKRYVERKKYELSFRCYRYYT